MHIPRIYFYIPAILTLVMVFLVPYTQKSNIDQFFKFKKSVEEKVVDACPKDLHYSYFSTKDFFDKAYDSLIETETIQKPIKGILVNHHLLASHLIAKTMNTVATSKQITVVLVSPNHFSSGRGQIISSLYKWDTPYGTLNSDCKLVSELEAKGVLTIDEFPFKKEHGISGIVPFIKKSLPNARIIPIIVKDTISKKDVDNFVDTLYKTVGGDVIVIGSFDFSHYLPSNVADFHDAQAVSSIKNFDYEGVSRMDTDSTRGLELVMKYMEKEGANHFDLIDNTNSAKLINDKNIEETTSYINGTFYVGEKNKDKSVTVLSFGDMMLDRYVRKKMNENGDDYPFIPIKRFLMGSDIIVVNSEGPFTSNLSETLMNPNGPLKFTFDPKVLPLLKKLGFTLFSNANNHTLNFGSVGLNESEKLIEQSSMKWFGDPLNENLNSYTTTIREQKVTFIGYHQFANKGLDKVLHEIKNAKDSGSFVLIYPHWGEEYKLSMTQTQIDTAHVFVDSGADVVIGSHPHVIEPIEIYKNKAIFYSLGNFIFDQDNHGPTSEGLSVGIIINDSKTVYYLFPVSIKKAQVSLMRYSERDTLLSSIAIKSVVSERFKNNIKEGMFELKQ